MTYSTPAFDNRFFTVYYVDQDGNEFAIATLDTLELAKAKLDAFDDAQDSEAAESIAGYFIEHNDEVVFSTLENNDPS